MHPASAKMQSLAPLFGKVRPVLVVVRDLGSIPFCSCSSLCQHVCLCQRVFVDWIDVLVMDWVPHSGSWRLCSQNDLSFPNLSMMHPANRRSWAASCGARQQSRARSKWRTVLPIFAYSPTRAFPRVVFCIVVVGQIHCVLNLRNEMMILTVVLLENQFDPPQSALLQGNPSSSKKKPEPPCLGSLPAGFAAIGVLVGRNLAEM